MIELEFKDEELVELVRRFPGALGNMMRMTAAELHGNIREESPVKTGRLAGSWQLTPLGPLSYGIGSDVVYRFGPPTPPHEIRPVHAKALHFFVDGDEVFCKVVHHPGTAGWYQENPYVDRAIERVYERLEEFAEYALGEVT